MPPRRAYLVKDVVRKAHRAGLKVVAPPAHPFNPLPALRVAALDLDRELRWRIIDALFAATWAGGGGIESPEKVATVLRQAGLDDAALIARANTAEGKDRLRRNTDEALARGAFGVPTMFIGEEMFFGFDSFPDIEAFVRGDDPVAQHLDVIEQWANLPVAASRPRAR